MASIYGAVSATGWRLRLDYTVSQDAAENRSTLALALYIYDGTGESYNQAANSCRYVLQGKTVYHPYRYEKKGWYQLGSGSVTVDHRADGSGSAALSAAWYSGFTSQWTPASLSVAHGGGAGRGGAAVCQSHADGPAAGPVWRGRSAAG